MARVVIATAEPSTAERVGDLLVMPEIPRAADPVSAVRVLREGEQVVLLLDASAPWGKKLLADLSPDRPATVVVVADPESLDSLPELMRSGADGFVTLPTDGVVLATAIESARESRAQARAARTDLVQARKQLMRFAEDFRQAYRREREKALALEKSLTTLEGSYHGTVRSLALAVESKDQTTGRHIERVTELGLELARIVDPVLAEQPYLSFGFLLHDVGKIGVPDGVLTKNGPLSDAEFRSMREHPVIGARIVEGIEFLRPVHPIIRHHHERWDGGGYPDGLSGSAIPKAARIFSVADAADAMLHDRPYRQGLPEEQVRDEIERGSGTQFDPEVVEAFAVLLDSKRVPLGKSEGG